MKLGETIGRALKPDAQAFDEIKIYTVPCWKESELSGSEWRISAVVELWRKGKPIHSKSFRNIETAAQLLAHTYMEAVDNGKGFFAGEGEICDQEGCSAKATTKMELVKTGCGSCGTHPIIPTLRQYRMFCDFHKRRGYQSFDDSDSSYKIITETKDAEGV